MKLKISHKTTYTYKSPVIESVNEVRLYPIKNSHQTPLFFNLYLSPQASIKNYRDFFCNRVDVFEINEPHQKLDIQTTLKVQTFSDKNNPCLGNILLSDINIHIDLEVHFDFLTNSHFVSVNPDIWRVAVDVSKENTRLLDCILGICRRTHQHFTYDPKTTDSNTTASEAFILKRGVCQDYAHVMIAFLRALNIPARYVSGYFWIENTESDPSAGASHAWVEAYLPNYGWLGIDPTHNDLVDDRYVLLAIGRDYSDVSPVRGSYRGTSYRDLNVAVSVEKY